MARCDEVMNNENVLYQSIGYVQGTCFVTSTSSNHVKLPYAYSVLAPIVLFSTYNRSTVRAIS